MTPIQLQPVGNNLYKISYDYSLYPDDQNNFFIFTTLPFKGFNMPQGQVRLVVVLPTNAQIDPTDTTGTTPNGQTVEEQIANVANGRPVVSFFWQNDPDFTIKYRY
jgi:hypothetical protein